MKEWSEAVSQVTPFIVKIRTQYGFGTGFVFWQNSDFACIATANHVIEPANQEGWEQPFYISQPDSDPIRINPDQRFIKSNLNQRDSAAILIRRDALVLPSKCLSLWDFSREIPVGSEIGWLGFPDIVDQYFTQPSFFSGIISNVHKEFGQFTIDGVAISGVSGGPVFCKIGKARPLVMGTISSYFASKIETAEGAKPSPGLAISNDVSVFVPEITELNGFNKTVHSVSST